MTPCIEKSYTSLGDCFGFVSAEIEQREFYVLVDEDWEYCGAVLVGSGAITFRIQANACMNAHSKDIWGRIFERYYFLNSNRLKILPDIYLTMPDGDRLISHQSGLQTKKVHGSLSGLGENSGTAKNLPKNRKVR